MPRPRLGSSWTRQAHAPAPGSSWTRSASAPPGSTWTRSAGPSALQRAAAVVAAATAAFVPGAALAAPVPADGPGRVVEAREVDRAYVVRALPGRLADAERAITSLGGEVTRRMSALGTLAVRLSASEASRLAASGAVASVVADRRIELASSTYDAGADPNSLFNAEYVTGVRSAWNHKRPRVPYTGQGVDIALIDSGVTPVKGLDPARIVNGPDLSFEGGNPDLRHLDTYGHGTHMAGIMLGKDAGAVYDNGDKTSFIGAAPDARLVSLKVADARGMSDVTQVLAAIDWVVQNRTTDGLNIRVLNLSFGTDSMQAYDLDPLAQAVETAWHSGIVVVTSAGNSGAADGRLTLPAVNPYVIAVGASDSKSTIQTDDDVVPAFSSRGDGARNPDILAPGRSLQSLRVPGSYVDQVYTGGIINDRFVRGSGTSQASALVSGAVAVMLSHRPTLVPDQVKWLLRSTANKLPAADPQAQGAGLINLRQAMDTDASKFTKQAHKKSSGYGSIDASRGSAKLVLEGVTLEGEKDVHGEAYDSKSMADLRVQKKSWNLKTWNKREWTGDAFTGTGFGVKNWAHSPWTGSSWAGSSWAGSSWASGTWSGSSWAGSSWAGSSWAGSSWAGSSWAGSSWAGSSWASGSWD